MAQDFDQFPIYSPIVGNDGKELADNWGDSLSTFWQTLVGFLGQWGVFFPSVSTAQRNALLKGTLRSEGQSLQTPAEGQSIYNSDRKTIQIYLNGEWREVTTTLAP